MAASPNCLVNKTCYDPNVIIYPGTVNIRRAEKLLLDKVCNKSQVHPRWISRDFHSEGTVHIRGPNHATKSYPTTVDLEVEGVTLPVRMAVTPNIEYDVIMGVDIPNIWAMVPQTCPWKTSIRKTGSDESAIGTSTMPNHRPPSLPSDKGGSKPVTTSEEDGDDLDAPDSSEETSFPP